MSQENSKYQIIRLIQRTKKISSLPTVFDKVNELLNDPRSCSADFSRIISGDQALAARLLKLVNSAFYNLSRKIGRISEAVTIIGFIQLRELVLATSVLNIFEGIGENDSFSTQDF